MKKVLFVAMGIITFALSSCITMRPTSFVKAVDGGTWSSIMIRDGLTYDQAFNEVLDVISRRFEMDMISKEGGYGRTNWSYTWYSRESRFNFLNLGSDNRKYNEKYRTRVVFKFSADRKKVDIKTEAEFGGEPNWTKGYDTRLLSIMKEDISGVIGRTVL